jgi:hypothetical protein
MVYTEAKFWKDPVTGKTWHALRGRNGAGAVDALSMGELPDYQVEKTLAWCRSHGMKIEDGRGQS